MHYCYCQMMNSFSCMKNSFIRIFKPLHFLANTFLYKVHLYNNLQLYGKHNSAVCTRGVVHKSTFDSIICDDCDKYLFSEIGIVLQKCSIYFQLRLMFIVLVISITNINFQESVLTKLITKNRNISTKSYSLDVFWGAYFKRCVYLPLKHFCRRNACLFLHVPTWIYKHVIHMKQDS